MTTTQPNSTFRCYPAVGCVVAVLVAFLAWGAGTGAAYGASVEQGQKKLLSGAYSDAIKMAGKELADDERNEDWHLIRLQGLLTTGQYPAAYSAATNALERVPGSIRLRWLAREAFQASGHTNRAAAMVNEMRQMVISRSFAFRDAANLVVVGQAAMLSGADPKEVLTKIFETAKRAEPTLRDTFLAQGNVALDKHDYALAAKTFQEGLKLHPEDPDLLCGLAKAYADGEHTAMIESVEAALSANPRHVPSLLLLAEDQIDAENYSGASKLLDQVQEVNPWHPDEWAFRAVLAHLRNDGADEEEARGNALKFWPTNPRVDHLIGQKLSQKYRFAEGAARQRQALEFDPEYLPARAQLATDLLRLGDETEGWRMVERVHHDDGYDVQAYNLVTLRDGMKKFASLTNDHFVVRMNSREATIFGPRVLELLEKARKTLSARYGIEPVQPTYVEIFSNAKDFGVRTFGMPDNPGYLGVCFGRVVTANSPSANTGSAVNWEAVLWHEFCHVITLQLTRNRMPRWLSEGISVYEELRENPAWGQRMTPKYREMILGEDFTPLSRLSGAFLAPKSPLHLQFAYFESELVVEFLTERFGIEALKAILHDLAEGTLINAALEKHTVAMGTLEKDFEEYAHKKARDLAPGLDWKEPPDDQPAPTADWIKAHPTNFWALKHQSQQLVEAKKWAEAKEPLGKLIELYPGQTGRGCAYELLALAHRSLGETNEEQQVLTKLAGQDDEATAAYLRLMELAGNKNDWAEVRRNAERFLAVNPLVAPPYRHLARAGEASGEEPRAIAAYQTMLLLDPQNPADVHFRLARLLDHAADPSARRHVLMALEEAPRHRAALQLLLKLGESPPGTSPQSDKPSKVIF